MKKLLEFIAKSILEHPKDIKVTEEEDKEAGIVRLKLVVHPDDIGRAIGKEGRIANAVRNLLKVIAIREGKRVYLDIATTEEAEKPVTPLRQDYGGQATETLKIANAEDTEKAAETQKTAIAETLKETEATEETEKPAKTRKKK